MKLDRHCVHHAQKVLHCPYEGTVSSPTTNYLIQHGVLDCGEEFRDAGELLDHIKDMHEDSDLLPSTSPVPYTGRTLDPLPEQVPSWTIFPASVAPVPISADRHSQIGRWVSFTCFVDLDVAYNVHMVRSPETSVELLKGQVRRADYEVHGGPGPESRNLRDWEWRR